MLNTQAVPAMTEREGHHVTQQLQPSLTIGRGSSQLLSCGVKGHIQYLISVASTHPR